MAILENFQTPQTYFSLKQNWTVMALKWLKLNETPILIGILRISNAIMGLKLPLCKNANYKLTGDKQTIKEGKGFWGLLSPPCFLCSPPPGPSCPFLLAPPPPSSTPCFQILILSPHLPLEPSPFPSFWAYQNVPFNSSEDPNNPKYLMSLGEGQIASHSQSAS